MASVADLKKRKSEKSKKSPTKGTKVRSSKVAVTQDKKGKKGTKGKPMAASKGKAKAKAVSQNRGRVTGLNVREAYEKLFKDNEARSKAERLTDAQLLKLMAKDFPGKTAKSFTTVAGLQSYRSYYNRGGFGTMPSRLSHSYAKGGEAIEVKKGPKGAAGKAPAEKKGDKKKGGKKKAAK